MTSEKARNGAVMERVGERVVLSYRTPVETVRPLLPPGLEPVTRGPWAFWQVVVGLHRAGGTTSGGGFVSYRLLVQAMNERGELRRGSYVLRDDVAAGGGGAAFAMDVAVDRVAVKVSGTARGYGDASIRAEAGPGWRPADASFATLLDALEFFDESDATMATETDDAGRTWMRLSRIRRSSPRAGDRGRVFRVGEAKLGLFDALGQGEARLELATRLDGFIVERRAVDRERVIDGRLQHHGVPRRRPEPEPVHAAA
jgi:hypothetical protein